MREEQKLLKKKQHLLNKGNKSQLANICNDLAELYAREGKYLQSIVEYKEEAQIYKEMGNKLQYATVNRMIGEMYNNLAEFDTALKYQETHLKIANEENDDMEIQRALTSLGRTYLTKAIDNPDPDSLKLALNSFKQSLTVCDRLKSISKLEQIDMKARSLLNIGVVYENFGKFEEGIEYIKKSIHLCKNHDIYDQLHQGYVTLGLLYNKTKNYGPAIENLNLAIDVADRLSDKIPQLCAALSCKAELLIKLADFHGAKPILLKAFKLKTPNIVDRNIITHNLKVVYAMCKAEDELVTTPDYDYKKKKSLYEKMGDGACDLKNFNKAIDYYKKMLECAEASGELGTDLIPVYVSLAQTYKDNKQYDLAVEYFQKEYDVSRKNPVESYQTLLNIAEVLELAKRPFEEVLKIYNKARNQAQATGKMKNEGKVVKLLIELHKKFNKQSEVASLENELINLNYVESESESEEDSNETPDIGNDINISDISDESNSEEEKSPNTKSHSTRRRGKKFPIIKNQKGETQLHVACIKNNLPLVTKLLEQGHPLNIRDNCGWLPIHEACNHGYLEIVKILLDKGAPINDKGGALCGGVTPLHDACSNGHLEVIELMLNKGASALAQLDNGDTPLDTLKAWKEGVQLDSINQTFYETLVSRLTTILKKAGKPVSNPNAKNKIINNHNDYTLTYSDVRRSPRKSPKKMPQKPSPYKQIGNLRNKIDIPMDIDEIEPTPSCSYTPNSFKNEVSSSYDNHERSKITKKLSFCSNSSDNDSNDVTYENNSGKEYKRVMESLRNRFPELPKKKSPKVKEKTTGFLEQDDVGEDWLEDDLGINQNKKRKRNQSSTNTFLNSTGMRKSGSFGSTKNCSSSSPTKSIIEMELNSSDRENDVENEENYNSLLYKPFSNSNNDYSDNSTSNKRRKSQSSLLESGFCRQRSNDSLTNFNQNTPPVTCVNKITNKPHKRQQKLNSFISGTHNFEPDSTSQIVENQMEKNQILCSAVRSVLAVNVRIDGKLWRIPIPAFEMDNLTIEWLANEAAKRYYKKEGISPTLQLETKEGAILANEDPLSMIFIGEQSDEIQSTVISWNLPSLVERYVEACANSKIDVNRKLQDTLIECQESLNLKIPNFSLGKHQLPPLFKALNRQENLQYIDFSGIKLLNEGLQQLCLALPSIEQLRSLNLTLNNITGEGLRHFSNIFSSNINKPVLENLKELNFSYNLLGDDCLPFLAKILQSIKLKVLNLSGCNLTGNLFDSISNRDITLNLDYLEILDLSYNNLNKDSIVMFMSFLNFKLVSSINVSHNLINDCGISKEISENLLQSEICNIKSLYLARCKVNDSEVWDLLRSLAKIHDLETLDLSYNDDLTSVTLRRLLQQRSFSSLILKGCSNIVKYLEDCYPLTDTIINSNTKSLKISLDCTKYDNEVIILKKIWERQWGTKVVIEKLSNNFFHLSISK